MKKARTTSAAFLVMALLACAPAASSEGPVPAALASAPLAPTLRASVERALRARHYRRAEQVLWQAIRQNPKSSRLLALLGDVFFLDGRYLSCAVAMKKADALKVLDPESRFTLAMAYIAMKHDRWARPELERLARDDPHNALYPYWISRVDYHAMRLSDAVSDVKRALRLDPRFMKAYNNLGLYEEGLGEYREAISDYREAARLNQEEGLRSPWPALNLGALLDKLGRFQEAEACLKESLREAPEFPEAHFQLGLLFEKEKRDPQAIRELNLAIAYEPSYAEPYYVLGKIDERSGAVQRARASFRMFEKLKEQEQGDAGLK